MTDDPQEPVFGRPPVDGTEPELEEWVKEFLDRVVASNESTRSHSSAKKIEGLLDPYDWDPDDYPGDLWPTDGMIREAEWMRSKFPGEEDRDNDENGIEER